MSILSALIPKLARLSDELSNAQELINLKDININNKKKRIEELENVLNREISIREEKIKLLEGQMSYLRGNNDRLDSFCNSYRDELKLERVRNQELQDQILKFTGVIKDQAVSNSTENFKPINTDKSWPAQRAKLEERYAKKAEPHRWAEEIKKNEAIIFGYSNSNSNSNPEAKPSTDGMSVAKDGEFESK
jgi:hypothetical protein